MAPNIQPSVALLVDRSNHDGIASRNARLLVNRTTAMSRLIKPRHERLFPKFKRAELVLGKMLGSGAFSNVYELRGIELDDDKNGCNDCSRDSLIQSPAKNKEQNEKARETLAATATCDLQSRYAVKVLRKDASQDAAADLLLEQKYLAALTVQYPHPNIIQLHGISSCHSLENDDDEDESFLILERVDETLVERMETWRQRQEELGPSQKHDLLLERLTAALQLSSAMMHLHRLGIIYRDLKPNNAGFTSENDIVKLFDFGLMKELHSHCVTGMYCMSGGMAGSYKYMAPEVLLQKPYTLSADVYSFGMVLWQILSLEKVVLEDVTSKRQCLERVAVHNVRPVIQEEWSDALKELLESCWAREPTKRPTMKKIHTILQQEVEKMIAASQEEEA